MQKYDCYIIDDEPLAINVIEAYLEKLPQFNVSGTSTEPFKAFSELKNQPVDLLFIDIEMPDLNGIELIKSLSKRPEVIITTAYREFAVEGFELDVLDYLVKPISLERFLKAIDKFENKHVVDRHDLTNETPDFIMVRADRKQVKINLHEILFIEGLKDYIKIVMTDKTVLTKTSIGNFQQLLPPYFIRVHKSYLVSKNKITAYTGLDVELDNIEIPIGRAYKAAFLKLMETSE